MKTLTLNMNIICMVYTALNILILARNMTKFAKCSTKLLQQSNPISGTRMFNVTCVSP